MENSALAPEKLLFSFLTLKVSASGWIARVLVFPLALLILAMAWRIVW
jgi:hypothetical protein